MEKTKVIELAKKYSLANAADFHKANASAVVGKVISNFPEAKTRMDLVMEIINEQVNWVNSLNEEQIRNELENFSFERKKVEEVKTLSIPQAVEGKVVTRFPPEPSAFAHIGHAKAAFLSYEIAKLYKGKFILRFDDTNPENESQEFVDAIKEGLKWLQIDYSEEFFASDFMPQMYELANKLIENKGAYVCTCSPDKLKKSRQTGVRCRCVSLPIKEQIDLWNKMIAGGFEESEIVLRFLGKIDSENTALRDPTLFRILKTPHFRQKTKYSCWPTYDFQGAVLDSVLGITHALRSKEYELRDELYRLLLEKLELAIPYLYDFSRLNLKGTIISKRAIKSLIMSGKISGWDDPRLPTLSGLKRRGVLAQAIKNYVLSFGLSKVESNPNWNALLNENKKLLDPISKRYFFVSNPKMLKITNHPNEFSKAVLKVHPTNESFGQRMILTNGNYFVCKTDFDSFKPGEQIRLKDLYNVEIIEINSLGATGRFVGNQAIEGRKLHWLPDIQTEYEKGKLLIVGDLVNEKEEFNENSLTVVEGLVEKAATKLEEGSFVQFERVGFAILDSTKDCQFIKCD